MDELLVDNSSASDRVTIQRGRRIRGSRNQPVMGCISKNAGIEPVNYGILRADQTCGVLGHSVKHGLQVCGGVGDNPQNLAGGGLLTIARLKLFSEALYFFFELAQA